MVEGSYFGEIEFFNGNSRRFKVICETEVELYILTKYLLGIINQNHPKLLN